MISSDMYYLPLYASLIITFLSSIGYAHSGLGHLIYLEMRTVTKNNKDVINLFVPEKQTA